MDFKSTTTQKKRRRIKSKLIKKIKLSQTKHVFHKRISSEETQYRKSTKYHTGKLIQKNDHNQNDANRR